MVTVRDGVVESRRHERDGSEVPAEYAELFPSVEGLFAAIERERQQRPAKLQVTYDPTYGYPARIAIDRHARYVDDEVTYAARDLVVH